MSDTKTLTESEPAPEADPEAGPAGRASSDRYATETAAARQEGAEPSQKTE